MIQSRALQVSRWRWNRRRQQSFIQVIFNDKMFINVLGNNQSKCINTITTVRPSQSEGEFLSTPSISIHQALPSAIVGLCFRAFYTQSVLNSTLSVRSQSYSNIRRKQLKQTTQEEMIHNTTLKKLHVQTQAEAHELHRIRVSAVIKAGVFQEEAHFPTSSAAVAFLFSFLVQLNFNNRWKPEICRQKKKHQWKMLTSFIKWLKILAAASVQDRSVLCKLGFHSTQDVFFFFANNFFLHPNQKHYRLWSGCRDTSWKLKSDQTLYWTLQPSIYNPVG